MTSRTGLVKQNSGRVFTVGEGQTIMEIVGARGDLDPTLSNEKESKQADLNWVHIEVYTVSLNVRLYK